MAPLLSYIKTPCMWCLRIAKWLPVLFIVVIIVWSYYAYVIQLNILTIEIYVKKIFYILIYHILLVLFMWSYWQTVFTEIGRPPKQFRLPVDDLERYMTAETEEQRKSTLENFCQRQSLPVVNRTLTGDVRYCDRCCHVKPDRCHHCSVCGSCVLKMDHHCPWVNNCVAFTNYKFFVLFLGYALLYCLFIALTTLEYFIMFWTDKLEAGAGKFHILFVFFVSIMFAISLVSLFGYHIFLITKNRSTLESFRSPIFQLSHSCIQDKQGFSLGCYNNFIEIFGDSKSRWFLPVFTSAGNGVVYPLRSELSASPSSIPSNSPPDTEPTETDPPIISQASSLGDGVSYPQRCLDEDTDGLLCPSQRWAEYDEPNGTYNGGHDHQLDEVIVNSTTSNQVLT